MKITYPTWKVKSSPTPSDRLVICEKCGKGEWIGHGFPTIAYCSTPKHGRMREGTQKEYAEAKAAIVQTIGA
jgi:hypothetical protein